MKAISYLDTDALWFPSPHQALSDPNGLLAIGGDLSPDRLSQAYYQGIFPWFNPGDPILWWSPDPRAVFTVGQYHPSRSLLKQIRKGGWHFSINRAFKSVILACAGPRVQQEGTWITPPMQQAYLALHRQGQAHSIEVWQGETLVGGLYGLAVGQVFCGESMFHHHSGASKAAFWALSEHLKRHGFALIDAQVPNAHLDSLGANTLSREDFLVRLTELRDTELAQGIWLPREERFHV